jgi:cyanophycinase
VADERGFIIPIGGAEEKITDAHILKRFARLSGGKRAKLAIIPTASQLRETGALYEELFRDMGVKHVRVLPFESREDCEREKWLDKLERATGVFLTGGNQLRLSTVLGGSRVGEILRRRNATGLHVAGTSAGAAFLGEHMIAFGDSGRTPRADMVQLAPGLGLTNEIVVDQHFRQRLRLGRLLAALSYNPRLIGVGLDEDTAAFLGPDHVLEVVGSGAITILDPKDLEYSSMDSAARHAPVAVIGMHMHVLIDGGTFDLMTRVARAKDQPGGEGREAAM